MDGKLCPWTGDSGTYSNWWILKARGIVLHSWSCQGILLQVPPRMLLKFDASIWVTQGQCFYLSYTGANYCAGSLSQPSSLWHRVSCQLPLHIVCIRTAHCPSKENVALWNKFRAGINRCNFTGVHSVLVTCMGNGGQTTWARFYEAFRYLKMRIGAQWDFQKHLSSVGT